jgi:hypothetical protein
MKPGTEFDKLFFRFLAFGVTAGWKFLEFTLELSGTRGTGAGCHGLWPCLQLQRHFRQRNVTVSPQELYQATLPSRFHVGANVFYRHVDGDSVELIPVVVTIRCDC